VVVSDASEPRPPELRQLSGPAEMADASALLAEVFGAPSESMPVDLLTAVACAGGFVGGALVGGRLVGVAVGFGEISPPGTPAVPMGLHSHVAAVRGSARGLRVGQQLKWYQRAWALERGIRVIHWTFDPLVRRNAVMNLNRLGAVASTYYDNLYGTIGDALNAGMETDRLLVRWELDSPRVVAAQEGTGRTGSGPRSATGSGPTRLVRPVAPTRTIATPPDIETLVRTNLPAARAWRRAQRDEFHRLRAGWSVTGVDGDGNYEVEYA
jgi:predicted GNAT superfamily acetyltransferase